MRARTPAHVLIETGMQHDWPLTLPWLDESRSAWSQMRLFVEQHCNDHILTRPHQPDRPR